MGKGEYRDGQSRIQGWSKQNIGMGKEEYRNGQSRIQGWAKLLKDEKQDYLKVAEFSLVFMSNPTPTKICNFV